MPRGRPPAPQNVRALRGERRPSRTRLEPQPQEAEPQFPRWLAKDARPVWKRVSEELRGLGIWFRADQDAIAAYVQSVAMFQRAVQGLEEDGFASRDDHGRLHRSQWLMIRKDALDGIHRFGSVLGLSPTARASLNMAPQGSDYNELLDGPRRLLSRPR